MKLPEKAEQVFKGVIFDVYQWEQELYNGTTATFERIKRPDTTEVIAVKDNKIIVQIQEQPDRPQFYSLPGGRVDEGDSAFENARKELLEETGHTAEEWIEYTCHQPNSKMDWTICVYIARGLKHEQELTLDGGEKIELLWVTFDELLDLVDEGKLYSIDQELRIECVRAKYHQPSKEALRKKIFGE